MRPPTIGIDPEMKGLRKFTNPELIGLLPGYKEVLADLVKMAVKNLLEDVVRTLNLGGLQPGIVPPINEKRL